MVALKDAPEMNETEENFSTNGTTTPPAASEVNHPVSVESSQPTSENESAPQQPKIRLRQKTPITAPRIENTGPITVGNAQAALQRTIETLYESSPDMEENNEEIRTLDKQLDKLNDYMDRVEERLKEHNQRLTKMLKEQKEEREKRRQSFHERMNQNRQEDDEFSNQLAALLNRVDVSRRRATVIEDSNETL
jgi:septal ring factor EnvC (AmiA/AmiB activator)